MYFSGPHVDNFKLTHSLTTPMSYTIKAELDAHVEDDASSSDGTDSLCDWTSSLGEALHTKSLFSETILPNPQAALNHDEQKFGLSLSNECSRLNLDLYGRVRLINWIRREVSVRLDCANVRNLPSHRSRR